jgi:4-methylaminobutanoate oxidase (formaldehyde-forming)
MRQSTPGEADVAIVGAGILGCSIAWHILRRRPGTRVVVIDRQRAVATQASAQAAGLLTRARGHAGVVALVARTYAALDELEDDIDQPPPVRRNGTLSVASSDQAVRALDALLGAAVSAGLCVERPDPRDLPKLVPWLNPACVRSCAFMADDAFADPYLLANGYARAARKRGAVFRLGVEAKGIGAERGRVAGVVTAAGTLHAPVVVLAAGAWANRLTLPLGFGLAMALVRSHYWITEPDPRFPLGHPTVVMPDARAYARPELGCLLFGLRERAGASLDPCELPEDTSGFSFADDASGWESLEAGAPALRDYCPAIDGVGIRGYVAGVSTYTPDGLFLAGPVPGIAGLYVAGGCCGAGVAVSGGLGQTLAAMALGEEPSVDPAPFALDRFGAVDPGSAEFRARCVATRSGKAGG